MNTSRPPFEPAPVGASVRPSCGSALRAGTILLALLAAVAVGDAAAAPGVDGSCRAGPSWLDVDGRLGTVRLTRDGRRALLGFTREGGPGGRDRTFLRVVSVATGRTLLTTELGAFGQVTDIWASHEGTRVWMAAEEDGRVLTVDSRTGDLLMLWVVGRTSPQEGAVSAGDRYLYVTNRVAGTLTLINRTTVGARTVEVGRGVSSVDVWERGRRLVWLANRERDELLAVSGRTGEVVSRMASGGRDPVRLRIRPGTDEIWVAHHGSHDVVVVDARDREIVDRIPLEDAPQDLIFSADGEDAYVAVGRDRVLRIAAGSRVVMGALSSGEYPPALAMAGCVAETTRCEADREDPWTGPSGLPLGWLDDQRIVDGRICGFPERTPAGEPRRQPRPPAGGP